MFYREYFTYIFQVELEGLTGEIRFSEEGRRQNYTLHVVEMTVNSAMVKVAEWSDQNGFTPVAAKYVRPASHIERNRTYIVTTIVVSITHTLRRYCRCQRQFRQEIILFSGRALHYAEKTGGRGNLRGKRSFRGLL